MLGSILRLGLLFLIIVLNASARDALGWMQQSTGSTTASARREAPTVRSGTLTSIPGVPIRVVLDPPASMGTSERGWIPTSPRVVLLDHETYGLPSSEVRTQLVGITRRGTAHAGTVHSWLPEAGHWLVVTPESAAREVQDSLVFWMLLVHLPEELDRPSVREPADGRERAVTLAIGSERFPVRLAPSPAALPYGLIEPIQAPIEEWRRLGRVLLPEVNDPTRRWRASLIAERFTAQRLFGVDHIADTTEASDPLLEIISATLEAEWRDALLGVAALDAPLAANLLARLTAVIVMPDGTLLPAWPTDGTAENQLLPLLLSRNTTPRDRLDHTRRYLQAHQTPLLALLDDAGTGLSRGERSLTTRSASVLIVEPSGHTRQLTAGLRDEFDSELISLDAWRSRVHRYDMRLETDRSESGSQPVSVSLVIRERTTEVPIGIRVRPIEVTPPGLALGPSLESLTLHAWNTNVYVPSPDAWQSGALLYKDQADDRWKMFVEARFDRRLSADAINTDRIELYFGPYSRPDAVVEVGPSVNLGAIALSSDRWSAVVDIPPLAMRRAEREGSLAFGFVRSDPRTSADGDRVRSSWPRPLLPGILEPARFRFDLSAWRR